MRNTHGLPRKLPSSQDSLCILEFQYGVLPLSLPVRAQSSELLKSAGVGTGQLRHTKGLFSSAAPAVDSDPKPSLAPQQKNICSRDCSSERRTEFYSRIHDEDGFRGLGGKQF